MYHYLDFHTGPDDRIVRMTFIVEFLGTRGWARLRIVQQQTEGFPRLVIQSPRLWRARLSHVDARGSPYFRLVGSEFGSPGWWLDLTPSPTLPTFARRSLAAAPPEDP